MKTAWGLLLIGTTLAPLAGANDAVIAPESLNRFLAGVRDFAGGKLTPGPLYDPQSAGLPVGGISAAVSGMTAASNAFTARPPSWRGANGKLTGSQIARSPVAHAGSIGQTVARESNSRRR
jgi:hypothetical protein